MGRNELIAVIVGWVGVAGSAKQGEKLCGHLVDCWRMAIKKRKKWAYS